MKVGDLVMLKESCRDSGRYASVLSVSDVLNVYIKKIYCFRY